MYSICTLSMKAEKTANGTGKLSKVITYESGNRVEIPINPDGSVKWFDDTLLIKNKESA